MRQITIAISVLSLPPFFSIPFCRVLCPTLSFHSLLLLFCSYSGFKYLLLISVVGGWRVHNVKPTNSDLIKVSCEFLKQV